MLGIVWHHSEDSNCKDCLSPEVLSTAQYLPILTRSPPREMQHHKETLSVSRK
uniref:Uncharacterized protein n=1 Tax=Rhizophora mucronata TaxID=61149 RepID=A0A2P2NQH8_RHIMU